MKVFCALVAIIAVAEATTPAGVPCMSDSDCQMTECCYKKHDDLVVSKRQGTFEGFPVSHHKDYTHVQGVCQGYKNEGDFCSIYDKRNGYCSCNDKMGMACQYLHTPVSFNSKKRQLGSYRCAQLLVSK